MKESNFAPAILLTGGRKETLPTYEYACTSCGNRLEVYQSFSADPLEKCELCGGPLRRVFHPVGVLFKGSGFYSTDSRKKADKGKPSETKKAESKAAETKKDSSAPASSSEKSA